MPKKQETNSAEGFIGNIFKFSISTFANVGIYGLAILLTSFLVAPEVLGQVDLFVGWTNTIMTIVILGMDQALIRFYYDPPKGLSRTGLFRVCFYFSSLVLLVAGTLGSTFLAAPLYRMIGFDGYGLGIMPLLFINAFFFMVLRYFNVLYRMEMDIKTYTLESILMQFFYKLFYLFGVLVPAANPVFPMVACSLLGLGGFALVFSLKRRSTLRPRPAEFRAGAYGTLVPYAVAIAPTAIFITLNSMLPKSILAGALGSTMLGIYTFAYSLSNIVSMVQGGFASFWGAYMFENYETQRARIYRVHDYLNFVILCFFALLVAVEDIMFWVLSFFKANYIMSQTIFPLMMLGAVFTILCETTVYGNALAKRPIFDTVGIGLSFAVNLLLCLLLVRQGTFSGLIGAGLAVVTGNFVMFLFRTLTAQRLYRTIEKPLKTTFAVAVAICLAAVATLYPFTPQVRVPAALVCLLVYCLLYRPQLKRLWGLGVSILGGLLHRKKA